MRPFSLTALLLALGLAAPGLTAQQAAPAPKQEPSTEVAKPTTGVPAKPMSLPASAVDNDTYILGGDDVIAVLVWREENLSGAHTIRPDGKITMPLIKDVQAGGLTPNKVAEEIAAALSKFINNPDVAVSVEAVRSRRYFVDGEGINRPGAYPLATTTTVFEAITMAGGFREFANKKNIVIMRGDKRMKFNWNEVVKGRNLGQNINVENGDRIMVQ
jgi:polysaccharide export outer membrane protein